MNTFRFLNTSFGLIQIPVPLLSNDVVLLSDHIPGVHAKRGGREEEECRRGQTQETRRRVFCCHLQWGWRQG